MREDPLNDGAEVQKVKFVVTRKIVIQASPITSSVVKVSKKHIRQIKVMPTNNLQEKESLRRKRKLPRFKYKSMPMIKVMVRVTIRSRLTKSNNSRLPLEDTKQP